MSRPRAVSALVVCTILWGFAFLFQKGGTAYMGPLIFIGIRYAIGGLLVLPFAIAEWRRRKASLALMTRRRWFQFAVLIASFFVGVWAQQVALKSSTITNGGFLTSLYVIFTPLAAFVLLGHRPHRIIYLGAPLALIGIYLLTGADFSHFTAGDALLIFCAVCWGIQIAALAPLVQETGLPVTLSAACFLTTALFALIGVPFTEHPTIEAISAGWIEILYTGIAATAIAFTLQAIGQQYVPAANAAIILSAESLFAALAGALFLGERLPPLGYLGAAVIFGSILLVELVPQLRRPPTSPPAG